MMRNLIDIAFLEGKEVRSFLDELHGENSEKITEKFSYKFLEALRRQDRGEFVYNLIRLYLNLDNRKIPEFFKELLNDFDSMNQIGYAFLLGLNSTQKRDINENTSTIETISDSEEMKFSTEEG